jgi:hypothetical protein
MLGPTSPPNVTLLGSGGFWFLVLYKFSGRSERGGGRLLVFGYLGFLFLGLWFWREIFFVQSWEYFFWSDLGVFCFGQRWGHFWWVWVF